ncbi:hypothetical protein HDU77_002124 [Chytriomyces hyalinus]|nr:hypothetical protein HDU77_002124 [Chytriomyces hyalinus]
MDARKYLDDGNALQPTNPMRDSQFTYEPLRPLFNPKLEWNRCLSMANDPNMNGKDKPVILRMTDKAWAPPQSGKPSSGQTAGLPTTKLMANGKDLLTELKM